jgi:hypothetical protein
MVSIKPVSGVQIDVEVDGPFFTKGAAPVEGALKGAVAEVIKKGEAGAKFRASRHRKTGRYTDALKGRVAKTGRSGRVKAYGGKKRMGYATVHERGRYWPTTGHRFSGYKVLKETTRDMITTAPGILQKHVDKAVRELNG